LGAAAMAAHKRVSGVSKEQGIARVLRVQTLSQHGEIHGSGRKKERRRRKEKEWHGHYGLPASSSSDPSRAPDAHHHCTCGSGGVRVLHGDDGGWFRFAGAGHTSSVRNLDVDKVGAADSLTRAVMVMVIIVVERVKRPRHEEVDGVNSNGPSIN
jgi:hypothetical protein